MGTELWPPQSPPKRYQVEMLLTDAAVGGLHRHTMGAVIARGTLLAVDASRVVLGINREHQRQG